MQACLTSVVDKVVPRTSISTDRWATPGISRSDAPASTKARAMARTRVEALDYLPRLAGTAGPYR